MGVNAAGFAICAILFGITLCVALFYALKCLRRRRREVNDEEANSISTQSTDSTDNESPTTPEGVVDHMAICRRVVPCFASAEYEGPSTREGKFVYGGSLLNNVQQPSAEDLARAGYEPIATTGGRDTSSNQTIRHNSNPQTGDMQTQNTSEESLETSDPVPTFIGRAPFSAQPRQPSRFYNRHMPEHAGPLERVADHPRTQRFRPESYDRTIRHRSWTPGQTTQSQHAIAEPRYDGGSRYASDVNLSLPEIRRLPTLRMPDRT